MDTNGHQYLIHEFAALEGGVGPPLGQECLPFLTKPDLLLSRFVFIRVHLWFAFISDRFFIFD